jgi:hypothetical protein
MFHGMMGNATVRGGEAGGSGFIGVNLNFGTLDGVSAMDLPPHWANDAGGSIEKSEANNVSLSQLTSGATITIVAVPASGNTPTLYYSVNNGATVTYSGGFSVTASDYLKIGAAPPAGFDGYGTFVVNANGEAVGNIDYYWSAEG